MLSIQTTPACRRSMTRRDLLFVGGLALGSLPWSALGAERDRTGGAGRRVQKDKSVVLLFLQGGPPQIETFDPKLDVAENNRSATGVVQTKLPGVWFGGTFPQLAQRADQLAVVRSFASGDAGHKQTPMLTGMNPFEATMGALAARGRGALNGQTATPNHTVVLPEAVAHDLKLSGTPSDVFDLKYVTQHYGTAGQLGQSFSGFMPMGGDALLKTLTLNVPRYRFEDRRLLLEQLDNLRRDVDMVPEYRSLDAFQRQAFHVLTRQVVEAFDLRKEDSRTVARYDTSGLFDMADYHPGGKHYRGKKNQSRITNLLGKQLLLARRLCEAGCGFVTVVDSGWDLHGNEDNPNVADGMAILGPQLDRAVAAFLDDLADRGLSDKVMLIITGEMGRVPIKGLKGDGLGPGGTGHNGKLTPLVLAGGGLKTGQVIGRSNRTGHEPSTSPYLPPHLLATVLHTLFDPAELRIAPQALPGDVAKLVLDGNPIPELF